MIRAKRTTTAVSGSLSSAAADNTEVAPRKDPLRAGASVSPVSPIEPSAPEPLRVVSLREERARPAKLHQISDRRSTDPRAYDDIQVELTRIVFEKLMGTVVIGFVGTIAGDLFMAAHYRDRWFDWLGVATVLTCVTRIAVIYLFNRKPRPTLQAEEAYRWELSYGMATIAYTSTLAMTQLYCFQRYDFGARIWVAMGTFAFCSAIAGRLAMRPWIGQVCGLMLLLTLGFSLLRTQDQLVEYSSICVVLYSYLYSTGISSKFSILVEKIRAQRELVELAQRDALTGLGNRRHFESRLAAACSQSHPFAILFIDLDKFKSVNDTCGHAIGDALLQAVAHRLRQAVGGVDYVARLGGDEFAVLQASPGTEDAARTLAARINQDIAATFELGGHLLQIGASIGVRLVDSKESDAPALLRSADLALYKVKGAGGSSFALARSNDGSGSRRAPASASVA